MILAVTGGRNYSNLARVRDTLSRLRPRPTLILHGGATGADELCDLVAHELGIPTEVFKADWDQHGKAAGPIRNARMIARHPDLLIAFPGGRGTDDMIRRAHLQKVRVLNVGYAAP